MEINCKEYAQRIKDEVREMPGKKALLILSAGYNPASESYVKGKLSDCAECGIPAIHKRVKTQEELEAEIVKGNGDDSIAGIIIQLPLPYGFDEDRAVNLVADEKDVDGFKAGSAFEPCTPEGIIHVMKQELGNDLSGKNVLLIGRGKLVGKPLIEMLLREDCTLTICHSKTKMLNRHLWFENHDAVIVAVGRPKLVDLTHVSAEIVIDAGVNRDYRGRLCGDCYLSGDSAMVDYTPVPGGIGLMTRAMLMKHVAEASVGGGANGKN